MKTRWTIDLITFAVIAPMALGVVPREAAAQPATAGADSDDPNELFHRGYDLYDKGQLKEAVALWERALVLLGPERGGKLRYNLGLAYEQLGDMTRAAEHYTGFISWIASTTETLSPEYEERRVDAAARLSSIKRQHTALVFASQPVHVTVSIDDGEPRPVGFTAYVDEGAHRVVITGPTGARREEQVQARKGVRQRIDTTDPAPPPKPAPAVVPVTVTPPPEPRSFPLIPVLIGVGLTGASFALPGVMRGRANQARADAEELGPGHTEYADARDVFESRRNAYHLSYLLPAGLGAVTLGVAVYGVIHVTTGEQSEVAAAPTPGGGALWWRRRF